MSTDSTNALSNTELSSFLGEDIYIIEQKKKPENSPSKDLPSPASENNEIIVVIKDAKEKSSYGELLKKILYAVQIDIKNTTLLNSDEITQSFSETKFKFLISFGVTSEALGLNLKEKINEIKEVNNAKYLFTNTLEEIENEVPKKKSLWVSLQILFK